jgi:Helix-turn-helix domain
MDVVFLPIKFFYLEIHFRRHFLERCFNHCKAFSGKHLSSILGDADQVDLQVGNAMPLFAKMGCHFLQTNIEYSDRPIITQAMKARYRFQFYPTDQQQLSQALLLLVCWVVWNDALALCKRSETLPGFTALSAMLTQVKKTDERQWLKDVSAVPLQQSLRQLDTAYRNFFNSRNGKRKGGKMGSPRFKKKTNSQSAEFTKAAFSMGGNTVYLAKIGDFNPVWSRD